MVMLTYLFRVATGGPPRGVPVPMWQRDAGLRWTVRGALILIGVESLLLGLGLLISPRRVLNAGLTLNVLSCLLASIVALRRIKVSKRRFVDYLSHYAYELCPVCGYILHHLPDNHRCPECSTYYRKCEVVLHWRAWAR